MNNTMQMKFKPLCMAALGLVILSLLLIMIPMGNLSYYEHAILGVFIGAEEDAGEIITLMIQALLCAAAVFAVYSAVKGQNTGFATFFVVCLVVTVVDIVYAVVIYSELEPYLEYKGMVESVLAWMGIELDGALLKLARNIPLATIASGIAVALASKENKEVNFSVIDPTSWICSCGVKNSVTNTHCTACGEHKPEKPRCECGAPLVEGRAFCGKCGRKLTAETPAAAAPVAPNVEKPAVAAPVAPPVEKTAAAASERKPAATIVKFEPAVEKKNAVPAEKPAGAERKCSKCGRILAENQTACPVCTKSMGFMLPDDMDL